ncbi:MAG: hypothetical protein WD512_02220, partial [Candidatus Paceibacterota bacterium]
MVNSTTGLSGNNYTQIWNRTYTQDNFINWGAQTCLNDSFCQFSLYNRSLSVNFQIPVVDIKYPSPLEYFVDITQLNYTASDLFPSSCWYSNNSGQTNYSVQTFGNNFTISDPFGTSTYYIYCNDTSNNIGLDSITFTESRINFTGEATNSTSTANFLNQDWVYADVDLYTTNLSNVTFNLYTNWG